MVLVLGGWGRSGIHNDDGDNNEHDDLDDCDIYDDACSRLRFTPRRLKFDKPLYWSRTVCL